MNIGIYGDSFTHAHPLEVGTWCGKLVTKHGHQVHNYGAGGSSIIYSASLLEKHWQQYDLNIWCLTTPGRISLQLHNGMWIHHVNWLVEKDQIPTALRYDSDSMKRLEVCKEYVKYLQNYQDEMLIGRSLAHYHLAKGNVMIIPCFGDPLKDYTSLQGHKSLWDACEIENQHYFPGQNMVEVLRTWEDKRPSHFTPINHEIISDMVNEKLVPGMFDIDLARIQIPNMKFEDAFRKWK